MFRRLSKAFKTVQVQTIMAAIKSDSSQAKASVAKHQQLPFAGAADRNKEPISKVLFKEFQIPKDRNSINILEIGSGTGQHIEYFAELNNKITWHPSDYENNTFWAIKQRTKQFSNVEKPKIVDLLNQSWCDQAQAILDTSIALQSNTTDDSNANNMNSGGINSNSDSKEKENDKAKAKEKGKDKDKDKDKEDEANANERKINFDGIYICNVLHISAWDTTVSLLGNAYKLLNNCDGLVGKLIIYGPFLRGKDSTKGNINFSKHLQMRNSKWGVREMDDVIKCAKNLKLKQIVNMPSNNFCLVFEYHNQQK